MNDVLISDFTDLTVKQNINAPSIIDIDLDSVFDQKERTTYKLVYEHPESDWSLRGINHNGATGMAVNSFTTYFFLSSQDSISNKPVLKKEPQFNEANNTLTSTFTENISFFSTIEYEDFKISTNGIDFISGQVVFSSVIVRSGNILILSLNNLNFSERRQLFLHYDNTNSTIKNTSLTETKITDSFVSVFWFNSINTETYIKDIRLYEFSNSSPQLEMAFNFEIDVDITQLDINKRDSNGIKDISWLGETNQSNIGNLFDIYEYNEVDDNYTYITNMGTIKLENVTLTYNSNSIVINYQNIPSTVEIENKNNKFMLLNKIMRPGMFMYAENISNYQFEIESIEFGSANGYPNLSITFKKPIIGIEDVQDIKITHPTAAYNDIMFSNILLSNDITFTDENPDPNFQAQEI